MAEFIEIMRNAERMCESFHDLKTSTHRCNECPLNQDNTRDNCFVTSSFSRVDFRAAEQAVMEWVAEHPELVYPTWLEWLMEQKILARELAVPFGQTSFSAYLPGENLHKKIPEETARILEIEPKEG